MNSLKDKIEDMEREEIINALRECNCVMAKAARKLGITERMIGYKIRKYDIQKGEVVKDGKQIGSNHQKRINKNKGGKMKGLKTLSLAVILTLLISVGSLCAEETKTSGYASVDVLSNYVWRGQKLSNSWVVEPSVGITYGSFGANIWANYDSDRAKATETDLTLNYSFSANKFNFTAGYIYYALEGVDDTQEVYFSANYDIFLKPALTIYYDYDEGDGAFILASICHSFGLSKDIALNLGASVSYNINNKVMGFNSKGDDFSNFYNAEFSSSLSIPVSKAITLTPKIAYSFPLSNDAKEAIKSISDDGDRDIFYGGINLTLSF